MMSFTTNLTQRLTATEERKKTPNKCFWWNRFLTEMIPPDLKPKWTVLVINVSFR